MTDFAVLIPFYGTDDIRYRNERIVASMFEECNLRCFQGGSGVGRVSLASCRNLLAKTIEPLRMDVLVFNDADTLPRESHVREAVRLAAEAPGIVFAFDTYLRLSAQATGRLNHWVEAYQSAVEQEMFEPPSVGCIAIRRDCFEAVGGFDEGFVGWGYEDIAFRYACSQHWPERRVQGEAVHLWHGPRNRDDSPVGEDPALVAANLRRLGSLLGHPIEAHA